MAVKTYNQGKRISPVRLLLVLAIFAGLIGGSALYIKASFMGSKADEEATWFAPYVDVTLSPTLHFEDPAEEPSAKAVLGFVVADPKTPCQPSWGTYYSLDAAGRALDLDRRIVQLRDRGGDAMVSFGGALNQELATVCTDPTLLFTAYQSVIQRYNLSAIDFDIEAAALDDTAANARRASVIQQLQLENKDLVVWLTLPGSPQGLPDSAVNLVDQTLAAGVRLAGVNVMTMDYGDARSPDMSMREATSETLNSAFQQLDAAYEQAGVPHTPRQVWSSLGATPMIGQNDSPDEVFTTADASWLLSYARQMHMSRISIWSGNRDAQCAGGDADQRVSNLCSGVSQTPSQFAQLFEHGTTSSEAPVVATPVASPSTRVAALLQDDRGATPYPIWTAAKAYLAGDKVVWQDRVYEAKWWSSGSAPDTAVKNSWDTPWRYLGPVLASDRAAMLSNDSGGAGALLLPSPPWQADQVYLAGDQVDYGNQAFQAKWWTQGDMPQSAPDQPFDHPWKYLGQVSNNASSSSLATSALGTAATTALPPAAPLSSPLATSSIQMQTADTMAPDGSVIYHIIAANDTLDSLAARYGVSADALAAANGLLKSAPLHAGWLLRIPVGPS